MHERNAREARENRRRVESALRSARRRERLAEARAPDPRAIGAALVELVVPRMKPDVVDAVVATLVRDGFDADASIAAIAALAARTPKTPIASNAARRPRESSTSA